MPNNALRVGYDIDNAPMFVGRCAHAGDFLPAKVLPTKNIAYVSYAGTEIMKYEYDVN